MEPKKQTPSVGRVVYYISHGSPDGTHAALQHRAAIITEVYHNPTRENEDNLSTNVGLCVLNPNGMYFQRHTPYDATGMQPGTWHWPEYVA